jgi:hypothetical protein
MPRSVESKFGEVDENELDFANESRVTIQFLAGSKPMSINLNGKAPDYQVTQGSGSLCTRRKVYR